MGVGTMAMLAMAATSAGSAVMQYKAQKTQIKEQEKASKLAQEAALEQQKEADALKAEERKERIALVDDMRTQLGAGLSLNTLGTKFKKTITTTSNSETLG